MKNKIPNSDKFNFALSTMQKSEPIEESEYIKYEIYKKQIKQEGNSLDKINTRPSQNIYFRKDSPIKFESIMKKIKSYLDEIEHVSNEKIIQSILYCCCYIPRSEENAVIKINQFLSFVTKADINQYIIYPIPNHYKYNLRTEKFQVSTFEHLKFRRYCEKFGNKFFDEYGEQLTNKLSIKKDYETITVLDLPRISELGFFSDNQLNNAFQLYFEELQAYYIIQFKFEFSESQNLMTFYHRDFIDISEWSTYSPWNITIFLNMGTSKKMGWIIPRIERTLLNFQESDKRYEELKKSLSDNFGKSIIKDMAEKKTINKFLEFSAKAQRHISRNRINEGFLHFIIAIDLLFGDKENTTNSITTKVAICVFQSLNMSFTKATKVIGNLYNIRSNYVHNGDEIKEEELAELERINKIIFEVLLRNNTKTWNIENWLKKLKILISIEQAALEVTPDQYKDVGISST